MTIHIFFIDSQEDFEQLIDNSRNILAYITQFTSMVKSPEIGQSVPRLGRDVKKILGGPGGVNRDMLG